MLNKFGFGFGRNISRGVVSLGMFSAVALSTFPEDTYFSQLNRELSYTSFNLEVTEADTQLIAKLYSEKFNRQDNPELYTRLTEQYPSLNAVERALAINKYPFCGYGSLPTDGCFELQVEGLNVWSYPEGSRLRSELQREGDLHVGSGFLYGGPEMRDDYMSDERLSNR
jgi:hypothetical protein